MTPKATILLILSLATVAFSAAAPAEPNDAVAELKFEKSPLAPTWTVSAAVDGELVTYYNPGSVRPEYAAKIILPRNRMLSSSQILAMAMDSPLAKEFSPAQKEFLAQGFAAWVDASAANVPNHYSVNLYAVSEEDARIMVRAFMDGLAIEARENLAEDIRGWDEWKQGYERSRRELIEKQERRKEVEPRYDEQKKTLHPGLTDDDAEQLAKELIFQMGKEGNTLDIELAGIRAKLQIIDEYRARSDLDNDIIERLEAMRIDQLIELRSLEARRQAIGKILSAEQEFCSLYGERKELREAISTQVKYVGEGEETLKRLPEVLKGRREAHAAPQVYKNTVTLYPIAGTDSEN